MLNKFILEPLKSLGRLLIRKSSFYLSTFGTHGPNFVQNGMIMALESMNTIRSVKTPYGSLKFVISNEIEKMRIDKFFSKEPETLSWLDKTITPSSVLYDVGANIGQYSLYAAHMFAQPISVVAFEPESLNFSRLNQNIYLNNQNNYVKAFCMGLDLQSKISKLNLSIFKAGCSLHSTRALKNRTEVYSQGCVSYALDDFIIAAPFLPFPTHIKMDVDGTELEILKGASNTLKNLTLKHLLVELEQEQREEALHFLSTFNFNLIKVTPLTETVGNYIFYRK